MIWWQHRNGAYCKGFPSAFFRDVSDYTALVPHLICQRGGHPFAPPYLGPALLPRLIGALPDHSGHAENPGKLPEIVPYTVHGDDDRVSNCCHVATHP